VLQGPQVQNLKDLEGMYQSKQFAFMDQVRYGRCVSCQRDSRGRIKRDPTRANSSCISIPARLPDAASGRALDMWLTMSFRSPAVVRTNRPICSGRRSTPARPKTGRSSAVSRSHRVFISRSS
jgi:hypothetical protein